MTDQALLLAFYHFFRRKSLRHGLLKKMSKEGILRNLKRAHGARAVVGGLGHFKRRDVFRMILHAGA